MSDFDFPFVRRSLVQPSQTNAVQYNKPSRTALLGVANFGVRTSQPLYFAEYQIFEIRRTHVIYNAEKSFSTKLYISTPKAP